MRTELPMEGKLLINGQWVESASGERIEVLNPADRSVLGSVPRGNADDIDAAVVAAQQALRGPWGRMRPRDRAALLYEISQRITLHAEEFATMESLDVGKPLRQGRAAAAAAARYFGYYAGVADKLHGDSIPLGPDYVDFTLREPLGVTAHIIPWNLPLDLACRGFAPALAAGCTIVAKPAEQTPLTALMLGELLHQAGLPAGVLNIVTGYGSEAGAPLASHPGINGITFTGSVATGRKIMQLAATHIRPVVLELGGKSPNIVFADANMSDALNGTIKAITLNAGQVCSAGSRLLVQRSVRDSFVGALAQQMQELRLGPGISNPDMGPLVSEQQLDKVCSYLQVGREEGAHVVLGGGLPSEPELQRGYFVQPTIFDQVQPAMRIAQEEIFGPVLTVLEFDDDEEALTIANNTPFGLVAGVYTRDISRALRLAKQIQAGQIFINEYFAGGEETPFGGYKQSGFGREKGLEALDNYLQTKNVAIRL